GRFSYGVVAQCRSISNPETLSQNLIRPAPPVSAALLRRHEPLQLLVEVLDDDDLRRRAGRVAPARLEHQEPLTIGSDVVIAGRVTARAHHVAGLEHLRRRAGRPPRLAPPGAAHPRALRRKIEHLLPPVCP